MDFDGIWQQARELWGRPLGKWIVGGALVFLSTIAVISYIWSRPAMVTLGTFDAVDAPRIAAKLDEARIKFEQTGTDRYIFSVSQDDVSRARLAVADLKLDPTSAVWGIDSWKDRVSWSNTDFDKRRLWVEQTESNLTRAVRALSVVENARVQISVPTEKPLFKEQEKPPKASVFIQPKKGQELTPQVTRSVMETVAAAVEGLEPAAVVVMDVTRSKVVSRDIYKAGGTAVAAGEGTSDQWAIQKQYQDHWQQKLTDALEPVVGSGNVSVIVNPTINWDRAIVEALEYKGAGTGGKGIPVSEQSTKKSGEGPGPAAQGTTGTSGNADTGVPGYPTQGPSGSGGFSQEEANSIINYLVNQTKTVTEKPSGAISEIAVGIFVNKDRVDAATEQSMKTVVTAALGSKAKVEVAAILFAASPIATLRPDTPQPQPQPAWLIFLLAGALILAAIGIMIMFLRPRQPAFQPAFAGPEGAVLGGIPVTELDLSHATDAYGAQVAPRGDRTIPELTQEDIADMAPEEIALLGDEFLQRMGVDPAKVRMKEKIEKLAKANPEAVAQLIKTWMLER